MSKQLAVNANDRERIRAAVRAAPSQMTLQLARQLEVPEVEVIRALPDGRAVELVAARWQELLGEFAELGDLHVIVSNNCVTSEVVGTFGGFSSWGPFFNVQSGSLDMHIRHAEIAAVFAVLKPSHMDASATYSFQFYDRAGNAAFKVFLNFGGKAPAERVAAFERLRDQFRAAGPVA